MERINTVELIRKYTAGEATLEETNDALKQAGGLRLEPGRNVLTDEELRATTIGYYPDMANGFGLLDSGTGTFDKVRVKNGRLLDCDMGQSQALVLLAGRVYQVRGDVLADAAE